MKPMDLILQRAEIEKFHGSHDQSDHGNREGASPSVVSKVSYDGKEYTETQKAKTRKIRKGISGKEFARRVRGILGGRTLRSYEEEERNAASNNKYKLVNPSSEHISDRPFFVDAKTGKATSDSIRETQRVYGSAKPRKVNYARLRKESESADREMARIKQLPESKRLAEIEKYLKG